MSLPVSGRPGRPPAVPLAVRACVLVACLAAPTLAQEIRSTAGGGAWSSPATWSRVSGSGALPGPGDLVVVSPGSPVVLDTDVGIGDLAHLDVQDVLTVEDARDYALGVSRIDVGKGGTGPSGAGFHVGSATHPFTHRFELTLTEAWLSSDYTDPLGPAENKSLVVHGGATLELHGRTLDAAKQGGGYAPIPSWMRLADGHGLAPGDDEVVLEAAANGWLPRDRVVVASTDFDMEQAEERTIRSVDGARLVLTDPVDLAHHGVVERGLVDERAEVARLSRNVVVQGDALSAATERGGHVMFHDGQGALPSPVVHVAGVEFRYMGWKGRLGRYPIHFHQVGSVAGSSIRSSSIHHVYNRAITIHGTHDLVVADVVAFDGYGHLFYLEDGSETGNVLRRNLGLVTRAPDHPDGQPLGQPAVETGAPWFTAEDASPATYWITNFDNTFEGNVAAGSDGHGFWYELGVGVKPVVPARFRGNTAHSNAVDGFHQETGRLVTVDPSQPDPLSQLDSEAVFEDFTAYKNRNAAVWHRSYGVCRWRGTRVADNAMGFYLASEGYQRDAPIWTLSEDPPYHQPPFTDDPFNEPAYAFSAIGAPGFSFQILESSVVLGETANVGNPTGPHELNWIPGARSLPSPTNPQRMLKGLELYDGAILVEDTHFEGFRDTPLPFAVNKPGGIFTTRSSAAVTSEGWHSKTLPGDPWGVDPRNAIRTSTFTDVDHAVLFPQPHPGNAFTFLGPPVPSQDFWVGEGPNGVASALVFDIDGSLPGSAPDTYHVNNTPLLRPAGFPAPTTLPGAPHYAEPLVVPGPGTAGNHAYGQLEFDIVALTWGLPWIRFEAVDRPGQQALVYTPGTFSPFGWQTSHPITLLLDDPDEPGVEHYRLHYPGPPPQPAGTPEHDPALDPRDLVIRLQFSEPGRSVLLEIPYDGGGGGPSRVEYASGLMPDVHLLAAPVSSVSEVEDGDGTQYHYDAAARTLWLKPTLGAWTSTALHPIFDGREISYFVQG